MMAARESPNHDARPVGIAIDLIVLHYTGMPTAAAAIERMCDSAAKVSAHWVVDEDGSKQALVAEERRAWHAGVARWAGADNINARSIGIEIVNPGHEFGYRPFPATQMATVIALVGEIVARWSIPSWRVVGHSDVAPLRKEDPGELFDWGALARIGIGLWPGDDFVPSPHAPFVGPSQAGAAVLDLQIALDAIGYGIEGTGLYDPTTEAVVRAFQRHFRQRLVDGVADPETTALIHHLAEQRALRV